MNWAVLVDAVRYSWIGQRIWRPYEDVGVWDQVRRLLTPTEDRA